MSVLELVAHVHGTVFVGPPVSYVFDTQYLCQASFAGTGLFDVSVAPGMGVSEGDAKVTVICSGDAFIPTFDWNAPDPLTGVQSFRVRVFDSTGALANPDIIAITIERLTRI